MKSQLLCTFTTKEDIDKIVEEIKKAYTIVFSKIYVLQNEIILMNYYVHIMLI